MREAPDTEPRAEVLLRRIPLVVPALTLLAAGGLYAGIAACLHFYEKGVCAIVALSGRRFPLGMGIGNLDAHHRHPGFSWTSMAVGLALRPRDTDPLRTVWAMLRHPEYVPYAASRPGVDRPA